MSVKLPKKFYKYFWDIKPENIEINRRKKYIIERLLELGDIDALRWVNQTFDSATVKDTIKSSRQLSPKTANYFSHLFSIPRREIRCLQEDFQNKHRRIWPS